MPRISLYWALALAILSCLVSGEAFAAKAGREFPVNVYTAGTQYTPRVVALADESFVVVWASEGEDGDGYGIFFRRYDKKGRKKGKVRQANTYTTGGQIAPAVAALQDGGFVIVWESENQDGDNSGIFAQRFKRSGKKKGPEFQVNTYTTDSQGNPEIATLENGAFVVVWSSRGEDGDDDGVYGQRFRKNGKRRGGEFRVNTTTAQTQRYQNITALADGGFVVVWSSFDQDGDGYGVYARRYDRKGRPIGGEFLVNTTTTSQQIGPVATKAAKGGFAIAWMSNGQDGDAYGVYAQRFNKKARKAGGEFLVNTRTAGNQGEPGIAGFANGGFVVIWSSGDQDGSGYGIYAQRYKKSGASKGHEFQVNTYTNLDQGQPAVTALGKGFVAIWSSFEQDGSDYGIYGKRFSR